MCPKEENVRVTEDRPVMKEATHRALKQLVGSRAAEDEDTGLGDSLPNTASSSQASLSALTPSSHTPLSCSSSGNSSSAPPNPLTLPLIRVRLFSLSMLLLSVHVVRRARQAGRQAGSLVHKGLVWLEEVSRANNCRCMHHAAGQLCGD